MSKFRFHEYTRQTFIEGLTGTWWRHQMETFSALLAICAGNSPVPGEFPAQRPVTRSFDVFFDLRLNKRLSKQSWGWWSETLSRPLWRHRNVNVRIRLVERSGTRQRRVQIIKVISCKAPIPHLGPLYWHGSTYTLGKKVVTPPLKTIKPMWIEFLCFHLAEIGMIWTRDCSSTKSDTTLGRHSMQGQVGSSSSETTV